MFLCFADTHYVIYYPAMDFEIIRNERPVTTPPECLRTHIGSPFFKSIPFKFLYRFLKESFSI